MTTRATRRCLLALLFGVQVFGAFVPLADALLERSHAFVVRVGEQGSDPRGPVHIHSDCALCQHMAHGRLADLPATPVPPGVVASPAFSPVPVEGPASSAVVLERGRSPPTV